MKQPIASYVSYEPCPCSVNVDRPQDYTLRNGLRIVRLSFCPGNHRSKRLRVIYEDDRGNHRECLKYANGLTNCTNKKPLGTDLLMGVRRPLYAGRLYQFTNRPAFSMNDSIGILKNVEFNSPYPYERTDIQKFKHVREIPEQLIAAIYDQKEVVV